MESRGTETDQHCFCSPKKENRNDLPSLKGKIFIQLTSRMTAKKDAVSIVNAA
jgi:hypothetical protein